MGTQSDLEGYFAHLASGAYSDIDELELNLLNRVEAELFTEDFEFHPIVMHLDALVLDDPGTSNHHVLLDRAPFEGQVLFLTHDGGTRVVFASITEFLAAADRAIAEKIVLPETHPAASPRVADQVCLSELIQTLLDEDETDVVLALIPSMDLSDLALLGKLATHEDYFLGELVALEIAKRPAAALENVAHQCAAQRPPQVAQAGHRALRAIRALTAPQKTA
jgi:hypothetical protein